MSWIFNYADFISFQGIEEHKYICVIYARFLESMSNDFNFMGSGFDKLLEVILGYNVKDIHTNETWYEYNMSEPYCLY